VKHLVQWSAIRILKQVLRHYDDFSLSRAHKIIKDHVNAGKDDVIITTGSGMTTVVCKFQRLLGLKIPEQLADYVKLPEELKPVVFYNSHGASFKPNNLVGNYLRML